MDNKQYLQKVDNITPNSPIFTNCLKAFVSGGIICTFAQWLTNIFKAMDFMPDERALLVNMILIGIASILTGLGLYSKLGKFCGAGTIVPITGFANSMVSPSIEYKTHGIVMGVGLNMFSVAGPVIVYGVITSIIVGIIHYFFVG